MSSADPFRSRFEVFGRQQKHTVEGVNQAAFEKLRKLLDVGERSDGRVVLLRAPRAGFGKTSILQRLAEEFEGSHHFVRVSLVSGRTTDAAHVLEYVLQALCQVLPDSTILTKLDLLARKVMALALEPLVSSGEVPCQDREGALQALREQPTETFDFHHDRAVTAHWTKSNFEILGPRLAAELAQESGASLREASYWVELLFRFATTAPDNVERARLLFETVFRGDLQNQPESAAEERLHGLLALLGTVTNVVLIVDDTEGLSTSPSDALALSSFLTNLSQCCPGTLVLLSVNNDIWDSAFLPLLPGGLADRLTEHDVTLKPLTREDAEGIVRARAGDRADEVLQVIDLGDGDLYARGVLKAASEAWESLDHDSAPGVAERILTVDADARAAENTEESGESDVDELAELDDFEELDDFDKEPAVPEGYLDEEPTADEEPAEPSAFTGPPSGTGIAITPFTAPSGEREPLGNALSPVEDEEEEESTSTEEETLVAESGEVPHDSGDEADESVVEPVSDQPDAAANPFVAVGGEDDETPQNLSSTISDSEGAGDESDPEEVALADLGSGESPESQDLTAPTPGATETNPFQPVGGPISADEHASMTATGEVDRQDGASGEETKEDATNPVLNEAPESITAAANPFAIPAKDTGPEEPGADAQSANPFESGGELPDTPTAIFSPPESEEKEEPLSVVPDEKGEDEDKLFTAKDELGETVDDDDPGKDVGESAPGQISLKSNPFMATGESLGEANPFAPKFGEPLAPAADRNSALDPGPASPAPDLSEAEDLSVETAAPASGGQNPFQASTPPPTTPVSTAGHESEEPVGSDSSMEADTATNPPSAGTIPLDPALLRQASDELADELQGSGPPPLPPAEAGDADGKETAPEEPVSPFASLGGSVGDKDDLEQVASIFSATEPVEQDALDPDRLEPLLKDAEKQAKEENARPDSTPPPITPFQAVTPAPESSPTSEEEGSEPAADLKSTTVNPFEPLGGSVFTPTGPALVPAPDESPSGEGEPGTLEMAQTSGERENPQEPSAGGTASEPATVIGDEGTTSGGDQESSGHSPFKPMGLEPVNPSASPFAKGGPSDSAHGVGLPPKRGESPSDTMASPFEPASEPAPHAAADPTNNKHEEESEGSPFEAVDPSATPFAAVGAETSEPPADVVDVFPETAQTSTQGPGQDKVDELLRQFKERYGRK